MSLGAEKRAMEKVFPDAPHQPNLSTAINTSTKDLHDIVNHLIIQRLGMVLGQKNYLLYREGIHAFYYPFRTFEKEWASLLSQSSSLGPHIYTALQGLSDPRLFRTAAISADLAYLYSGDGSSIRFDPIAPPTTPCRIAYIQHIEEVVRKKPHVLIAYAHNFYMALFAGGKILAKRILAAKEFFPVVVPAGSYEEAQMFSMNMYSFPVEKGREEELRAKFKTAMEALEGNLSEEEKTDIIEESRTIYLMNEKLIIELDEICASMPSSPMLMNTIVVDIKHGSFAEGLKDTKLLVFIFGVVLCFLGCKYGYFS